MEVKTTDKRNLDRSAPNEATKYQVDLSPHSHPIDRLIQKVFKFVLDQPEYWEILQMPRSERKRMERGIAKVLTRFPNIKKS